MKLYEALHLLPKDIIAAVGAGGKTTLLERLAAELAAQGACVISTTTTHIWQPGGAVVIERDEVVLLAAVVQQIYPRRIVTVASDRRLTIDDTTGRQRPKLAGVPPHLPALLASLSGVDYVLVEADGARGRAIKAPAAHEPVIPPSATVVLAVVGIEAVGQPLNEEIAHRPERIAALLGIEPGAPLGSRQIAVLLAHAQGGRKGVPVSARFVPFINKVEDDTSRRSAQAIAGLLCGLPGVDNVLIGSALSQEPVLDIWPPKL